MRINSIAAAPAQAQINPGTLNPDQQQELQQQQQQHLPDAQRKAPASLIKDSDARWAKKNTINYYGYENSICIDASHSFIRRHAVTPTNIHDSQTLPHLQDPDNEHDHAWTDSTYSD